MWYGVCFVPSPHTYCIIDVGWTIIPELKDLVCHGICGSEWFVVSQNLFQTFSVFTFHKTLPLYLSQ